MKCLISFVEVTRMGRVRKEEVRKRVGELSRGLVEWIGERRELVMVRTHGEWSHVYRAPAAVVAWISYS